MEKASNMPMDILVFRLTVLKTVQFDTVRRNTKISRSILLSFSINTYLYNIIMTEETLRYPASYYCPSPLIHTSTI
jgi:hypothetical protein